jgi:hypothetical protein
MVAVTSQVHGVLGAEIGAVLVFRARR